jgi:histidine triad (HIT) family protein
MTCLFNRPRAPILESIAAVSCLFCAIVAGDQPAALVHSDEHTVAFLDIRPVFKGHVLLVPRVHVDTLPDLPPALVAPFFEAGQALCRAVVSAMGAQGTFVAMNNVVSQSVPHLHLHVVPRRRKDGLRGFFWPRTKYDSDEEMASVAASISSALP